MAGLHATIGVLAALHAPARDRPRAARRGQPAVLGAVRAGQPVQRVRRRRRGPDPDGQQPPEPVPLRAAALLRRRPDHHRRQQRPVPQAGRGARRPRAGRRPAVRPQRGPHRQPGRAAAAAGRAAAHPHEDGVVPRHHRRGRALRTDQHRRRRRRLRRGGRPRPGRTRRRGRRRRRAVGAQPDHASPRPRPTTGCRRPALDEHGDEIRALAEREPERRPTRPDATHEVDGLELPHLAGHLHRRPDPAARPGPRPPT